MPTITETPDQLTEAHRLAGRYIKQYYAGGFAWPSRGEMLEHPERIRLATRGDQVTGIALARSYERASTRKDFTQTKYTLPAGSVLATHLAVTPGTELPIEGCTHVMAYSEDHYVAEQLTARGYQPWKHILTPSSAVLTLWALNPTGPPIDRADRVTVVPMNVPQPPLLRMIREAGAADTMYHDDNPFYSTGDWTQAAIRGYDATDPRIGIKPIRDEQDLESRTPRMATATRRMDPPRRSYANHPTLAGLYSLGNQLRPRATATPHPRRQPGTPL